MSGNVADALRSRLPILQWAPRYRRSWIKGDLMAGVIVAALAVPQALGYAGIAGVPVVVGIYAIPAALIAYAIFGSSPQLVVGPVSTVSVVSGSLVAGMSGGDPQAAIALTAALAIGSGLGLLLGGLLRIGWAAEFLSKPIVTGFVFGLVLVIIIGEVPKLLGVAATSGDSIRQILGIVSELGQTDATTAICGFIALVVLFAGARLAPRVPWGLLVLVAAIVASSALGLADLGVAVVGSVPSGLPPLGLPAIGIAEVPAVLFGGIGMALVGLAEGLSAARLFAAKQGYSVDSDQELIGAGAANIFAGFSGGMGVAGSLSKTAAAQRAGGRSQVTGLLTAVTVLIVLALFADALAPLPRAVLSAIVIQAVWGLMDVGALRRYRDIRRNDFSAALGAMVGVLLFGPLYGLLIAILMALLGLVYRSSRIRVDVMGKVPDEKAAWGSISRHPERRTYDGLLVLRLDSPLFWANASDACDAVMAEVEAAGDVRAVLLDLEATSQLDTTSIDALDQLLGRLRDSGIELYLVRVLRQARRTMAKAGFQQRLGEDRMWHSISAGVRAARHDAELTGRSHPQLDIEAAALEDEAALPADAERIKADRNGHVGVGEGEGEGEDAEAALVPRKPGRRWWQLP